MSQERKEFSILNRKIDRRSLFKGSKIAVAGSAVSVAAGFLIHHEVDNLVTGIETDSGIFIPLYENHLTRIEDDHIPNDLNVFFKEWNKNTNDMTPADTIRDLTPIGRKRLSILARQHTEIMLGDIDSSLKHWLVGEAILIAEIFGGFALYRYLNKKASGMEANTRRKFLKTAAQISLIWPITTLLNVPPLAVSFQDNMAFRRITARLSALYHHAHPEDYVVFLRSLIWADKLLAVAGDFKSRTGRKAKIGFNVGTSHSDVEDFLHLGRDFCRNLILAHPSFLLSELVDMNSGVSNFASARLLRLPEDLNHDVPSLSFDVKLEETTDRFVVDRKLEQGLRNKGF